MTTNPSDKATLKAFKNVKDRAAFAAALSKLRTEPAQNAFRFLHDLLGNESNATVPVEHMEALLKGNLLEASEFVFGKMEPKIAALDLDCVLRIAPTPRCLQLWIGAGGKKGGAEGDDKSVVAIERFNQSSATAMQSVLAYWFIAYAPAALLADSVALFITKSETRSFTSVGELLGHALRRDKDGKFTKRLLMECSKSGEVFERNIAVIRDDTARFDEFVHTLVRALGGLPLDVIRATLKVLFGDVKLSWRTHGREFCRRLVSTASAMLSVPQNDRTHVALTELDRLSEELQSTVPAGIVDQDSCGIRYHVRQRVSQGAKISDDGADLVALAVDKVHRGDNPLLVMEATAFNLGLRPFGDEGAVVMYDPIIHHDIRGGLMPGASIKVVRKGWKLGERIVERAKVEPANA